jgi:hypothetical protein
MISVIVKGWRGWLPSPGEAGIDRGYLGVGMEEGIRHGLEVVQQRQVQLRMAEVRADVDEDGASSAGRFPESRAALSVGTSLRSA